MNLLERKRSIRRVPLGMLIDPKDPRNVLNPVQAVADISPGDLLLLWASMNPVGVGTPFLFEMEFVPECPNPDPKRIPHEVWFAVDAMTCKRGCLGDYKRFRKLISGHRDVFEDLIASASNDVVDRFADINGDGKYTDSVEGGEQTAATQEERTTGRKSPTKRTLTSVTSELALPTNIDHLVYRRVILWFYQLHGSLKGVSDRLGYAKRSSYLYVLCQPIRLGLSENDLKMPMESGRVLLEEKKWIGSMKSRKK